jgi:hypothetical protein
LSEENLFVLFGGEQDNGYCDALLAAKEKGKLSISDNSAFYNKQEIPKTFHLDRSLL